MQQSAQRYYGKTADGLENSKRLQFWIGFSTACGSFYQFQLMKVATAQWEYAIYAREYVVISENSHSNLQVIAGTPFYYRITNDITFSGVLDLNQLNLIFNSFPVLTRNYGTLHLQLWIQDFLYDLKVVWLNKNDIIQNYHLAYHTIPLEKPEIAYLLAGDDAADLLYQRYNVRIVNMQNAAIGEKIPQNSISYIGTAKYDTLEIQNVCFNIENEEAIISLIQQQKIINFPTYAFRTQSLNFPFSGFDKNSGSMQNIMSFSNIKALFMTFAMPQYPTWLFPVLFT
ncbi:MAG: hypothetical protein EZS28_047806 [Streblomastix strix]|uniref:Uncharacterized protein n=1 Tax=Streblomastix strix TaxID=222440 RepID=A0A5J4TET1_9EUKA|nr:MAG: hypothetical protein EZS28_047806 [Streblomastix strix]